MAFLSGKSVLVGSWIELNVEEKILQLSL